MRRLRDRRPTALFRGGELPRLMTMLVMLGVIVMLMNRARDPATWSAIAHGSGDGVEPNAEEEEADEFPLKRRAAAQAPSTPTPDDAAKPETEAQPDAAPNTPAESKPTDALQPDEAPQPEIVSKPDAGLTPDSELKAADTLKTKQSAADPSIPIDRDPAELKAIEQEFDVVTDNVEMSIKDNFALWRLIRWGRAQGIADLQRRARKNIMFTQLWQHPEEHRGELVQLRMHIKRVLSFPAHDVNTPGVKRLYEAWGWTDESRSELYVVLFPELPKGMKQGSELYEEATFVGYFLKLLPYKSREGLWRSSPLLVGRVIWHPPINVQVNQAGEWKWGLGLAGGAVLVLFALRWLPNRLNRGISHDRPLRPRLGGEEDDSVPIEDWLEQAEQPGSESELDHALGHGTNGTPGINGNGAAGLHTDRLDGSKDRDG